MANLPSGRVLDSQISMSDRTQASYELSEILAALGLDSGKMASFEVLAIDLSRIAHKEPPWSKKYVHSVYKDHFKASPEFAAAIQKLAQMTDGTPTGVAGSAFVKVLADPASVFEGVLIPANAKVLKCARPGCPVWFVRVHPRQIYHDVSCRRIE